MREAFLGGQRLLCGDWAVQYDEMVTQENEILEGTHLLVIHREKISQSGQHTW